MKRTLAIAGAVLLQACVQMPQNAEDFRKAVADGAMLAKTETYEVNRPLSAVAATFQRRAPECLKVSVRTVSQTTTSYQNILTEYTPTVVAGKERVELHVQQLHKTGVIYPSKPPEGGIYLLVENQYDPARARLDIEYTFVSDGRIDVRRGSHRAYTYRELIGLLESSGFAVELAEAWTRDAQIVSFIATRI